MYELMKAVKALSDETRLRILSLLLQRECCVCEVMQVLDISQTRASRNLSMLYDAGFLNLRKEGLWTLYSLNENKPEYMARLVQAVELATANNKDILTDRERLESATRIGPGCEQKSSGACSLKEVIKK
jgi:ArsR family transcriptional regulator, arsenate/arsenite/antimonite-responsive transcriptional repressor